MNRIRQRLAVLPSRAWLLIVAVLALVQRVGLYIAYRPVVYSDTLSYRRLAGQLLEGWSNYDGTRMPGYPVFLAWVGGDERAYAVQLGLGFGITLLFFYIGWQMSARGAFAALAAAAYSLNPQQVLVEADLLSETLTVFLLAVCLAWLAWLFKAGAGQPTWRLVLAGAGAGAAAGLAALTRSLFVFLPVLAAFLLLVGLRARPGARLAAALAVGLTGFLLIGGWVSLLHSRYGIWALDTIGGYHLMNHAGPFFGYLPDEYAAVRDTFLEYQAIQLAETGHTGNAIWDAIPALQEASGLGFYSLSPFLARLALRLILEHPDLYLRNVALGWLAFWKAPVHWTAIGAELPRLAGAQRGLILALRGLLMGANIAFLAGSLALAVKAVRRRLRPDAFLYMLAGTIWSASILQALIEFGDNPRYSIPVQTLVLLVVLVFLTALWRKHETAPA